MDIKEIQTRKILGMIGLSAKAGKLVCGTDATIQEIEKHKVSIVIVASDASEKTKKNMKYICEKNKTKITEFGNIDDLSKAIGKNNNVLVQNHIL